MIPDCQVKPGKPIEHLRWINRFLLEKKPDVLVVIGDFADMSSLSSYDVGKKCFEGRTYKADIEEANKALALLMAGVKEEQDRIKHNKKRPWKLRKVVTLGNHENRINVAIDTDRKVDGLMSTDDIEFKKYGFEVYPFLKPVVIDGIAYCHYFTSGILGRPVTSARMLLQKHHMSCFAGHQQGRDIAYAKKADGSKLTGIIAGSCYLHDEDYLGPQGNECWRGVYVLHEVNNGSFDEMPVSLRFLEERYGP